MILPVSGFHRIYFDIYICVSCGYFEEYVAEKDLKDEKKIEKIKNTIAQTDLNKLANTWLAARLTDFLGATEVRRGGNRVPKTDRDHAPGQVGARQSGPDAS